MKHVYIKPQVWVIPLELEAVCVVYSELPIPPDSSVEEYFAPRQRDVDWEEYENGKY